MMCEAAVLNHVVDDDELTGLTNLVADGGFNRKFVAGLEAEGDLIANCARHPAVLSHAGNCREAHPGRAAYHFKDGRHRTESGYGCHILLDVIHASFLQPAHAQQRGREAGAAVTTCYSCDSPTIENLAQRGEGAHMTWRKPLTWQFAHSLCADGDEALGDTGVSDARASGRARYLRIWQSPRRRSGRDPEWRGRAGVRRSRTSCRLSRSSRGLRTRAACRAFAPPAATPPATARFRQGPASRP